MVPGVVFTLVPSLVSSPCIEKGEPTRPNGKPLDKNESDIDDVDEDDSRYERKGG